MTVTQPLPARGLIDAAVCACALVYNTWKTSVSCRKQLICLTHGSLGGVSQLFYFFSFSFFVDCW